VLRSVSNRARAHYLQFFLTQRPPRWPIKSWGSPESCRPGPVGLCWHNARSIAVAEPDRLAYVEGIVARRGWEQHGWIVDRSTGAVEEVTSGYEHATRYRGLALDVVKVDEWLGEERRARWSNGVDIDDPSAARPPGAIWIALYEFYEGRIKQAEFSRTLRQLMTRL
jgi:hypothetical protein